MSDPIFGTGLAGGVLTGGQCLWDAMNRETQGTCRKCCSVLMVMT